MISEKSTKMSERRSGILLHITSLPGSEGIGTFGENAFQFIDFLAETGQKIWQILPLGPVGYGNSPYQCYSAFAGNIFLIDLKKLLDENLLDREDLKNTPRFLKSKVDFANVEQWKMQLLRRAFEKFQANNYGSFHSEYQDFLKEHNWWLQDFALFMAAKEHFKGEHWTSWPEELKYRTPVGIHKYQANLSEEINFWKGDFGINYLVPKNNNQIRRGLKCLNRSLQHRKLKRKKCLLNPS